MVPASEIMPEFVRHKNDEKCERKRQSIKKRKRMKIGKPKGLEESVKRNGLVVRVSRGEVRAGDQRREQS